MFRVKVQDQEFEVSIDDQNIKVNEKELSWNLQPLGSDSFHLISGRDSYVIQVENIGSDGKQFNLVINGKSLELTLQDRYDLLLHKLGMDQPKGSEANRIEAPMPGLILEVMVSEGQQVEQGQPLLVLEAMKMENIIKSPGAGAIKSITVQQGQNVEKNQLLIQF